MRIRSDAKQRGERGQGLVLFVLAAGVLFGFTALAIDVGVILQQRRSMQNAADAAALAGAVELPQNPLLAQAKAEEWAANNGVDTAAGDEIDVTVDVLENSVTVSVHREQGFIFGRALGLLSVDVHADATARAGSPPMMAGILPFGVLESEINYAGTPTVIKFDAHGGEDGNRGILAIDGTGASIYEDSVTDGASTTVCAVSQPSCADPVVSSEPGNVIGATRDGINYRLDNTITQCDEFSEVLKSNGNGTYMVTPDCNPFTGATGSLRLVLIPVVDTFCEGSCEVTIQYFTVMFLEGLETCIGAECQVKGTFVKAVFDPSTDLGELEPGGGVKFVRLVE